MKRWLIILLLASGLAIAGGRAGYRVEVGQRFSIRAWAEQVLVDWGPFEQVAGAEAEYTNGVWYWTPYTGLGYNGNGYWLQVQIRASPLGGFGFAVVGGWVW